MAKSWSYRLRELAPAARGGITQPRTNFFGQLCTYKSYIAHPRLAQDKPKQNWRLSHSASVSGWRLRELSAGFEGYPKK